MASANTSATELLDREQACEFLKVGRTKLYTLTRSGELQSVSLPSPTGKRRPLRYERGELERFVAANRNCQPPSPFTRSRADAEDAA